MSICSADLSISRVTSHHTTGGLADGDVKSDVNFNHKCILCGPVEDRNIFMMGKD